MNWQRKLWIAFCWATAAFILIALLLPLLPLRPRGGRRIQSASNIRQIGLGLLGYDSGFGMLPTLTELDDRGRPLHSWQTRTLPYIDAQELFNQVNFARPWDDPINAPPLRVNIGILHTPGEFPAPVVSGLAPSHYAGNVRILGSPKLYRAHSIPDGAATTFLAGETFGNFRAWGDPGNNRDTALGINKTPDGFGAHGPTPGANFLFADGSVRFIKATIDPNVFRALGTPDAGDEIPAEY